MNRKIEIIPAILPKDFGDLEDKIELIKGVVKTVQIDACDGQFVRNANWPYKKRDESFDKIIHEDQGLPGWQSLNFEIDLMANHPEEIVGEWVSAGASRIIIHAEATGDMADAIDKISDKVEVGLALNVDSSADLLVPLVSAFPDGIKFIQCMGIDNIGFQGQEFDARTIENIKSVRQRFPNLAISIDGGVSLENAKDLVEAGADRLIVGSAIFESDNPIEAVGKFKRLVRI